RAVRGRRGGRGPAGGGASRARVAPGPRARRAPREGPLRVRRAALRRVRAATGRGYCWARMIAPPLDLRPGAPVEYYAAESGDWRAGTLVKPSSNGEEWLVKNRFGKFWLHVRRLRAPHATMDDAPDH